MLIAMGVSMVVPFMITIASSTTNDYDYQRFSPVPRFLYSEEDRYVKGLVKYFRGYKDCTKQLQAYFPSAGTAWSSWLKIGQDPEGTDALARKNIDFVRNHPNLSRRITADYSLFVDSYDMMDTQVAVNQSQAIEFLRNYYERELLEQQPQLRGNISSAELRSKSLSLLSEQWSTPYATYYGIKFSNEMTYPMGFQSWYPPAMEPKYVDFLRIKDAYRLQMFVPGVADAWKQHCSDTGIPYVFPVRDTAPAKTRAAWAAFKAEFAPASMAVPFALRAEWLKFLTQSEKASELSGLTAEDLFTVEVYNRLAGTDFDELRSTPFPVPESYGPQIQKLWQHFVLNKYPLRLMNLNLSDALQQRYAEFMKKEIKVLRVANELLGTQHNSWSSFKLSTQPPAGFSKAEQNERSIWMNFVKSLDFNERVLSSSEIAYQRFLMKKYGSLKGINDAYHWKLSTIEEAVPPLNVAYTVTFLNNQSAFSTEPIVSNYKLIFDFLVLNGNALLVTFILIALTMLATVTINPLCAYALSRFKLPGTSKIILFMLATMAFPAMVSAIPAYLLMRDLGLLNSFAALILPGAANGMAIFILKGFFDSLPAELYEAATIDGAKELQVFRMVAMPMVKPILAINCVTAFIGAYNGWEWALIICQDQDMWTLAVWMYQASQWWKDTPWVVNAGFVVISIPTMVVFISCQKIILRGVAIPSMK
jgi:multiple sugar transport system permease protein